MGPNAAAHFLEWGAAAHTLAGETQSGDRSLVAPFPNGALAAVVDGLGHGPDASFAAEAAVAALAERPHESVITLVERCHEKLKSTRGVVIGIASFNALDETMTWLGIGDVDGILLRAGASTPRRREYVLQRGGVVGYQLPMLRAAQLPVYAGDILLLATDGIRSGFADAVDFAAAPQTIADGILAQHARATDDSLILVVRYRGAQP